MNEDTYRDKLTDLQVEVEALRAQLKEAQTGDLISRAAAIDALEKIFPNDPMRNDYTQGITCGAALATEYIEQLPSAQPEQQWIPCSEPPEDEKNVFIAYGAKDFMTCCIGHYDRDNGLWYEDRNWFARPIFDGAFWCEIPLMPEAEG